MNKKILIGSIIAVAILVLVSFTSVVGYNSVKSNIKASPLFNIRSSRAIDRDSKDLTCDYVGRGEESVLSIPKRDDTKIEMEKVLDILTKMDGKTFNKFMGLVINRMKQNGYTDIDNTEIVNTLNRLRTYQEVKGILLANSDKPKYYSIDEPCTFKDWYPGCFFFLTLMILSVPVGILAAISETVVLFFLVLFTFLAPFCRTFFCIPGP